MLATAWATVYVAVDNVATAGDGFGISGMSLAVKIPASFHAALL